jgi:hypothetical protein
MRARPHTARDPQSHRLRCPTPNAAASIPTHAPLRSPPCPFFRLLRRRSPLPILFHPRPPHPRSPAPHPRASNRRFFLTLPALQPAGVMDDLARCGKRPTGPYRRVTGRGRLFPSTGTSASRAYPGHTRSPADFKVAAARELRHSTVRCSDGILAAAAPDGTEAADAAVRLKARVGRVHDLQELSTKPHRRRHSLAGPRRH